MSIRGPAVTQVRAGVLLWGPADQRRPVEALPKVRAARTQVLVERRPLVEVLLLPRVELLVRAEALPSQRVALQVPVEALPKVLADQLQSQGLRSQSLSTLSPLVAILVL